MTWIADLFARARWLFALFLIVMTGLAIEGYRPKSVDRANVRSLADLIEDAGDSADDEPADTDLLDTEEVTSAFNLGRSDAFLVVEVDDLFRPESARALRAMIAAVEDLPVVDTVFSLDDVPTLNVFGFAEPLLPIDDASPESFRQAKDRLLNNALARGQLISPDGKTLMMPLVYDWLFLEDNEDLTDGVLKAARTTLANELAQIPAADRPEFKVRITGQIPLFIAQERAFDRNQMMFRVIGYGLAFVLSVIMFRGVTAVLLMSAAPMLAVFWSFGLLKLTGVYINELSNVVMPLLVSMIGLTDGVHLLVNIRRRRTAGDSPVEAARWAIEHVGVACFLTSLTTAIGFGSLMLAESVYVQEFGRVCMYGVLIAFFAVMTFIPFVASTRLGSRIHHGEERDLVGPLIARMTPLLDWIMGHKALVSRVSIGLTLVLLVVSLIGLRPDNRIANQLPSDTEAYRALAHCDQQFGGIQFVQLWVEWPEGMDQYDPAILQALIDAEELIDAESLISHPLSVRNMLASFPGDKDDQRTQMTFLSLLPRELRSYFYRPDEHRALIVTRIQDQGIAEYVPVFDRLEAELAALPQTHPGFTFRLDGGPIFRARNLYQIVVDLATSLGVASIIILVVLAIVYRSLTIGLISVIPNMFPLVATGALLVVMGQPLFMSSVCAFTVCLGIAVDDTIHFLSRFQQEVGRGVDIDQAIRSTFQHVGSAMLMTTIILVAGFVAMLLSDLPAHRIFAAMACTTIAAAIVGDLIALPALLSRYARGVWKDEPVAAPAQDPAGVVTAG
ncbi:multidrug efflux system subunit MdtC [Posidoniimonas polymericola]|uniref:Multidrug efflux system subunit MdtC n=1 Tax=Posidoniimonas polymericola TaxID=2528002 RepID=A0A5C5YSC4_9BACT|nr:efflux RND transporter permease subunit [Posidoniimonas polymericola]TWT77882.1 multidrug efflux system subunit MdtC [Posidoniimonas polymericola]